MPKTKLKEEHVSKLNSRALAREKYTMFTVTCLSTGKPKMLVGLFYLSDVIVVEIVGGMEAKVILVERENVEEKQL